mgnify:CR=1 FL=1
MRYGINPLVMLALPIILSQPAPNNSGNEKRSRLIVRAIRGIFIAFLIGLLAFVGIYLMGSGVNATAGATVVNPIALGLLVLGAIILGFLGWELSEWLLD